MTDSEDGGIFCFPAGCAVQGVQCNSEIDLVQLPGPGSSTRVSAVACMSVAAA